MTRIYLLVEGQTEEAFVGELIACDIGLDAMRRACPHFNAWLEKLEALGRNTPQKT